jgi:hypothetical protein
MRTWAANSCLIVVLIHKLVNVINRAMSACATERHSFMIDVKGVSPLASEWT